MDVKMLGVKAQVKKNIIICNIKQRIREHKHKSIKGTAKKNNIHKIQHSFTLHFIR